MVQVIFEVMYNRMFQTASLSKYSVIYILASFRKSEKSMRKIKAILSVWDIEEPIIE